MMELKMIKTTVKERLLSELAAITDVNNQWTPLKLEAFYNFNFRLLLVSTL
jgi:hypothetical protein